MTPNTFNCLPVKRQVLWTFNPESELIMPSVIVRGNNGPLEVEQRTQDGFPGPLHQAEIFSICHWCATVMVVNDKGSTVNIIRPPCTLTPEIGLIAISANHPGSTRASRAQI
jgi:hypothetical protein